MKKAIALVVSTVIFCAALAGCGGSGNSQASPSQSGSQQETVASESGGNARVLQIGHVNPGKDNDQYHTLCTLFGEKLTALSGGAFEIDILSDSLLGGERDMMEGMKIGTVDMAIITNLYYGNFVQDFTVFDLPYIFANRDEAYSILDDGNIMDPLTDKLYNDCDVKFLAWGEGGFRHVVNTVRPINDIGDMRGLKIRVPENALYIDSFKAMGSNPTAVAFSETFTAVQQKTVDGLELPISSIYTGGYHEICNYLSLTGHFYSPIALNMARSVWESLSEEEQGWFLQAAKEAGAEQRVFVQEIESQFISEMEASGAQVSEISDKASFRNACESVYQSIKNQIGNDILDKIDAKLK